MVRVDRVSRNLGAVQGLRNSFNPILNVILTSLDAPPVFMRTKALRALSQLIVSDPAILAVVRAQTFSTIRIAFKHFVAERETCHREPSTRQLVRC